MNKQVNVESIPIDLLNVLFGSVGGPEKMNGHLSVYSVLLPDGLDIKTYWFFAFMLHGQAEIQYRIGTHRTTSEGAEAVICTTDQAAFTTMQHYDLSKEE